MHKTLIIGGATPVGYGIATNLKKNIRTCIQIVDDDMNSQNKNYFTDFEKFMIISKGFYSCNLIIINLYDVLGVERFQSKKYQLYLEVFNAVFEIIKNNSDIKIIVMANSHLLKHMDDAYNERFNSLNSFILDFLRLLSAIKKQSFQIHFLPLLTLPYYVDDFHLDKYVNFETIFREKDEREFVLINDVLSKIVASIVNKGTCNVRYVSRKQASSKRSPKNFSEPILKKYRNDNVDYFRQLEFVDYLENSDIKLEVVESDCKYIL